MRRRAFIAGLAGAASLQAVAARAQDDRVRHLAMLVGGSLTTGGGEFAAVFKHRLSELGWTEGHNLRVDIRFADGEANRDRTYAAELVNLQPNAIFVMTTPALDAVRRRTKTIPIVFTLVSDPVGGGYVTNLARPEGNITGFTNFEYQTSIKWLELLLQIAPRATRVTALLDITASGEGHLRSLEAEKPAGISIVPAKIMGPEDIERAFNALPGDGKDGLLVLPGNVAGFNRKLIVDRAAALRVPAVYAYRFFVDLGGLISYGFDVNEQMRQAASYVNRILRGSKPSQLPIQAPTQFQLVINAKTAKSLGLVIPPSLLAIADQVIE